MSVRALRKYVMQLCHVFGLIGGGFGIVMFWVGFGFGWGERSEQAHIHSRCSAIIYIYILAEHSLREWFSFVTTLRNFIYKFPLYPPNPTTQTTNHQPEEKKKNQTHPTPIFFCFH